MASGFKIFPSVTTSTRWYSGGWQAKMEEIKLLELKEVCLFPTVLNFEQRQKFIKELAKTKVERVPLVHIKNDFKLSEIKYYFDRYHTRLFNLHSEKEYRLHHDLSPYKSYLYLETTKTDISKELQEYAGVCLDVAHVEARRLMGSSLYPVFTKCLKKFPVGVAHVSAIKAQPIAHPKKKGKFIYDSHHYQNLSEFDYLKRYRRFLPTILALELENSLKQQLKAVKYLQKILS